MQYSVISADSHFNEPPGTWVDWWNGKHHEGGQTITVAAPLDVLPLFIAEGGIVPLLRPTIDTLAPTSTPPDWRAARPSSSCSWSRCGPTR